jgi:hypothetical protein
LTNTAKLDKNGRAEIEVMVNGKSTKKFLNELSKAEVDKLIGDKKSLEERAKASQTFDDKLTNLINMMKVTMLPIIDGIDSVLGPLVTDLLGNKDFTAKMVNLGKDIAGFVMLTDTVCFP